MSKKPKIEIELEKLRIVASTLVEDGQSVCAITEHLIREKGANRVVAENVVSEFYKDRQKRYRIRMGDVRAERAWLRIVNVLHERPPFLCPSPPSGWAWDLP